MDFAENVYFAEIFFYCRLCKEICCTKLQQFPLFYRWRMTADRLRFEVRASSMKSGAGYGHVMLAVVRLPVLSTLTRQQELFGAFKMMPFEAVNT